MPKGRQPAGTAWWPPVVTVYAGSTAHRGLVRVTSTGSLDNTFVGGTASVGTASTVAALVLQPDGKVVVGGPFYTTSTSAPYVARYDAAGNVDASFTPIGFGGPSARIATLVQQPDGKLLAGGSFTNVGGLPQTALARLNTNGQLDGSFGPGTTLSGTVQSVAVQPNGRVLVGGRFVTSGVSYLNLTRLLSNGVVDTSFGNAGSAASNAVTSLLVQPDGGLVVSGTFASIGGQPAPALARLTAPNVLAAGAPAAVAAATIAWPVPAREQLHVQPAPGTHPLAAELLDALSRPVRQQPLTGPAEFTLATATLAPGLYVLRLRYQEGTVSQQISVE